MKEHFKIIKKKLLQFKSFGVVLEHIQNNKDIEVYIAGGVVRNYFINPTLAIKDIDLFYSGSADKFIEFLKMNGEVNTGPFGSIRWFPNNEKIY